MFKIFQKSVFQGLILVIFTLQAYSQNTAKGRITDANTKAALAGVSVKIKGTSTGTSTATDGSYSVQVTTDDVLIFSFIGFTSQEIKVGNNTNIDVALTSSDNVLQDFVIVGSRNANRTELNTPVPIDIIDLKNIQKLIPQYDVNQILTYLAPSFNSNRQSASDGSEHIDPASLRGLSPDQTLVLINGKRRHTTSLLNNQGTFGNGSVGTDLNAIPASAIERIEILRDGASAQYGSDAIAGVINIVLKKNTNVLNTNLGGGITSHGDGELLQFNTNYGLDLGKKGGYLNFTAEYYKRGQTNRTANHDLVIFDQSALGNFFAYPFTDNPGQARQYDDGKIAAAGLKRDNFNFRVGDAQIQNTSLFYNLSLPFGANNRGEVYSFAGVSHRAGIGNGFRRLPSETSNVVASLFPNGFQPQTTSQIWDRSISVGVKYRFQNDWKMDLSNTFGNNRFDYGVNNTNNASLGTRSPTSFNAGGHEFTQNTVNLDFSKYFSGVLAGLNFAFGSEFRIDSYRIREGEEASWKNYALVTNPNGTVENPSGLSGGSQSFNGFTPSNAINKSRTNLSFYADADLDITKKWTVTAATRFENYSDFGSTLNGKLATRYSFSDKIALRAAASTGFRAPSLHQQYFGYVSTDILPSGTLGQSGFFRNDSDIAKSVGIPTLKQETSTNVSFGFTLNPATNFRLTVDGYLVNVNNRIVLTGGFGQDPFGGNVPEIQTLLTPFGANVARFFTNAINTTTQGVDIVATYSVPSERSKWDFTLAANFNKTSVGNNLNIPEKWKGQEDVYFSPAERTRLESGIPRAKANFAINYSIGKISAMLRNTYFGEITRNGFPFGEIQKHGAKIVTDISFAYNFSNAINLTIGANNLLDVFPDQQIAANSYFGVFKYAPVQMGTTGAFYFARLNIIIPTK